MLIDSDPPAAAGEEEAIRPASRGALALCVFGLSLRAPSKSKTALARGAGLVFVWPQFVSSFESKTTALLRGTPAIRPASQGADAGPGAALAGLACLPLSLSLESLSL